MSQHSLQWWGWYWVIHFYVFTNILSVNFFSIRSVFAEKKRQTLMCRRKWDEADRPQLLQSSSLRCVTFFRRCTSRLMKKDKWLTCKSSWLGFGLMNSVGLVSFLLIRCISAVARYLIVLQQKCLPKNSVVVHIFSCVIHSSGSCPVKPAAYQFQSRGQTHSPHLRVGLRLYKSLITLTEATCAVK